MNKKTILIILLLVLLIAPVVVTAVVPTFNLMQNINLLPLDGNVSPTDGGDEYDSPFCPGYR